jgi:hypothetical protein
LAKEKEQKELQSLYFKLYKIVWECSRPTCSVTRRSSSERTIWNWVSHNAERIRPMLIDEFRVTWDTFIYYMLSIIVKWKMLQFCLEHQLTNTYKILENLSI